LDERIIIREETEQRGKGSILQVESATQVVTEFVSKFGDIIRELLRAASNNPLMSVLVVLVVTDILEKAKLIYPTTALVIKGIVITATGVEFAGDILEIISKFFPLAGLGGKSPEGLLTPRATTIVYADSAGELEKALMPLLANRPLR